MVCSTWAANLVWVLMGANWLIEGRWREKWQMARSSRALHVYLAFYAILLIGLIWTENIGFGLSVMQVKLPLLVVPLVMLTSRPLEGRSRSSALFAFVGTVFVVSVISVIRMFTIPDLPYREAVPYISHIRFALCCCMVIFIAWGHCRRSMAIWVLSVAIILWMLCFLVLIRSYTAIVVLMAVSFVAVLHHRRRWWMVVLWLLVVGGVSLSVAREVQSYYRLCPMSELPLKETTAGGRPYYHACDGIVENGNYLNNYINIDELRAEWPRRSKESLADEINGGFCREVVLIRYLNACGLTKDSVGVWAMTEDDVRAVERGVENPVYESGNPLRKMVYVMLFERENWVHTGTVSGFTMLQRFELWRATWKVIKENPLVGVGTGDAVDAMHAELEEMDSELIGTTKRTHNEYLSLVAMVGFLGVAVLAVMFLRAVVRPKHLKNKTKHLALIVAWLIVVLVSFLTEDTLDTLAGILFCTWFLAFRPKTIK